MLRALRPQGDDMPISDNLRGTLYMSLSMMSFTVNDAFMKAVIQTLPLYQSIALRGMVAVVGLTILTLATGALRQSLTREDLVLVGLRSVADVAATILFLTALLHMPLANLSAILQAVPLAVSFAAFLVFGDRIGWRRLTAILVGFAGVLIVIRPGAEGFDMAAVLGLGSMACVVVRDLAVRPMKGHVPSVLVALAAGTGVMLMGLTGTIWQGWQPVTPGHALGLLAAGLFLIAGYLSSVTAMRWGEISLVAPFRYTSLLWAIFLGWMVFAELPDLWTMVGSAIIVGAGVFTLLRERALKRRTLA